MKFTSKLFGRGALPSCVSLKRKAAPRGRALLSYITNPFSMSEHELLNARHSNRWKCWCIADLLCEMGYDVDVIDYRETQLPRTDYDCIIDIHGNFGAWQNVIPADTKKILHITGAHWLTQNLAELTRLDMLKARRGCALLPRRLAPPAIGIEEAHCGVYLGNRFTRESFAFANKPLHNVPASTTRLFPAPRKNSIDSRRNHFLWLGSSGSVHKGLDLVLEAFSGLPDCQLSVCGPVDQEPDFVAAYKNELFNTPTLHYIGWADLFSEPFEKLLESTLGIVYPSCSEGCAGSVVTCMHGGLLPIVTYESGVEVQDFGMEIKADIETIRQAIRELTSLSSGELLRRSEATWEYARAVHTHDAFRIHYRNFLQKILG